MMYYVHHDVLHHYCDGDDNTRYITVMICLMISDLISDLISDR